MNYRDRIVIDLEKCTGCRTCELACSFHHFSHFDPSASSIMVHRDDGTGIIEIAVDSTCDACIEEDVPFCVQYCDSGCLRSVDMTHGAGVSGGV